KETNMKLIDGELDQLAQQVLRTRRANNPKGLNKEETLVEVSYVALITMMARKLGYISDATSQAVLNELGDAWLDGVTAQSDSTISRPNRAPPLSGSGAEPLSRAPS